MSENIQTSAKTEKTSIKKRLFSSLDLVLEVSQKKFVKKRGKDTSSLSWGRLLVSCIDSYAKLFQLTEQENLQERMQKIEDAAKKYGLKLE